jgi:hypothetical protein
MPVEVGVQLEGFKELVGQVVEEPEKNTIELQHP